MDPVISSMLVAEAKRRAARRVRAIAAGSAGALGAGGVLMLTMVGGAVGGSAQDQATKQDGMTCTMGTQPAAETGGPGALVLEGRPLSPEQMSNVKVIVAVGNAKGVGARGVQIAIATAIQESKLNNLDGGDRDSLGLFQQRPSQGWGTVQQIKDPVYSSTKFYEGLVKVQGWQQMPLTKAAQAVQRSGFPDAYAQWEGLAGQLAGAPGMAQAKCVNPAPSGSTFGDGATAVALPKANPRSVEQAVAWARAEAAAGRLIWDDKCLKFTAMAYGWGFSGTPYAIDQYTSVMPANFRHDGDRHPPVGALLFWDTGRRAGHVAIYVGGGQVASNDIVTQGAISIVPADQIEKKWGAKYLGWSPPYYPGGG